MKQRIGWLLIALLPLLNVNAQKRWSIKFEAKIVDENRQPILGAVAGVRGHCETASDSLGVISLLVPPGDTLYVWYIGKKDIRYKLPEVSAKGATIMMEDEKREIYQVVIQGEGGQIQRELCRVIFKKDDRVDLGSFGDYSSYYSFPGDSKEMNRLVNEHLVYPKEALERGIEGTVLCGATIDKEGYLVDVYIIQGVDELLDNAVLDAIAKFPRFIAARQLGRKLSAKIKIPIQFQIKNKKFKDVFVEKENTTGYIW